MSTHILTVITDKGHINEVKIISESLERGTETWLEVISLKTNHDVIVSTFQPDVGQDGFLIQGALMSHVSALDTCD